jgi:hypothetical protein
MTMLRKNPRKFDNKLIKDYSGAAAGTAGALAANLIAAPMVIKSGSALAAWALPIANIAAGVYISKKNPYAGAAIAGATLGATWQALAVLITRDISLLANSPADEARLKAAFSAPDEMAGLPENIAYLLGG